MQGRPPTAKAPCKVAAGYGQGHRRSQGQQPVREAGCKELVGNPTANRGSGVGRRGGCPLAGWLPAGKDSHRLRRGSSGDGGGDGAREVRASF
ncbi:hypothetical protein BHE74_00051202 [Ensete ventricosum]|nr:hypothetical protein BHE74_00051202 [Ensete ventricosum]